MATILTGSTMDIRTSCPFCGKDAFVRVPGEGYRRWRDKEALIQTAMPELSRVEREQLMTGICGPCWETAFAPVPEPVEGP